jgi:CheY-like chemotaxis protein
VLNAAAPDDQIRSGRAFVVLVVEDDVLARYALCDAFRYDGFTVLEASSFDEAKALLSSSVALDLVFIEPQHSRRRQWAHHRRVRERAPSRREGDIHLWQSACAASSSA